jgi:hypothetical protein
MSLPVPHSPPGLQSSCSRIYSFLFPDALPLPHTSSIQAKEALCAHNCITISRKNVHHRSTMPCVCCQLEALFQPCNIAQPCLTRRTDQHVLAREPRLDVSPMLRTDRQKTIQAALVCVLVACMAVHWFPCCALSVHRGTSWLMSLLLHSALTCAFTEM